MKFSLSRIEEKGISEELERIVCAFCVIKKRRAFEDESEKKSAFSGVLRSVVSLSSFS